MELSVQRQFSSEPRAALVPTVILETSRIHWCNIVIVTAAFIAFFLKLAIAYNTFGTNDVASFYMFAGSLRDHGLEWTYRNGVIFLSTAKFRRGRYCSSRSARFQSWSPGFMAIPIP